MAVAARDRAREPSLPPVWGEPGRRVYVWELPVRVAHWVIVISLVVLCFTGYYIHNPWFGTQVPVGDPVTTQYTMGIMRLIHEIAGFVFLGALLGRVYWAFVGNRYAHWRAYYPLTGQQRGDLKRTMAYYGFRRDKFPAVNGHNPLAGLAYAAVYFGFALSVLTGFTLYAAIVDKPPWTTLFGWTTGILPIQAQRFLHFLLMFWFIGFAIHHVYSAVLCDLEERNGELSSIVTGWKTDAEGDPADRREEPVA